MCRLRNIAMRDYQESVTTGQTGTRTDRWTDRQTDTGQSDPYVPLCFAGDTKYGQDQVSGGVRVLCWLAAPIAMFYGNLHSSKVKIGKKVQFGDKVSPNRIYSAY